MQVQKYRKALDKAYRNYRKEVDRIAGQAYDECVKPFCEKRNMRFEAGLGTWAMAFEDSRPLDLYYGDIIPPGFVQLVKLLTLTTEGCGGQEFGALM